MEKIPWGTSGYDSHFQCRGHGFNRWPKRKRITKRMEKGRGSPSKKQSSFFTHMFITALFTIGKIWGQPRRPSVDEQIEKIWCIDYEMEWNTDQPLEHFCCCRLAVQSCLTLSWPHEL